MRIIAAFAGCGKSYFCDLYPNAIDLVVMPFKYRNFYEIANNLVEGESVKAHDALELRYNWRDMYYKALTDTYHRYPGETIVIPSENDILNRLEQDGIPYTIAYPHRSLKDEYSARYLARGNSDTFLEVFVDGWDEWMERVRHNGGSHIELHSGEFLSDAIQLPRSNTGIIENKAEYIARLACEMGIDTSSDEKNSFDAI